MTARKKKDVVYQALRRAVISGELKPGEILKEGDLSMQYDVSKTPIREALIMLAHEGLVEAIPRTGYRITSVSMHDALEVFHLRELLEIEAVGMASNRITADEIATLKEILHRELHFREMIPDGDVWRELYQANLDFHYAVAQASGSTRLANLVKQFIEDTERVLCYDPKWGFEFEEHNAIIVALEQRDGTKAQQAMLEHIDSTVSRTFAVLAPHRSGRNVTNR